jgi:hypothetical protein
VTLLFSDIEGSTRLLSRLGEEYADALDGQRRVLREAWSEHGGIELGTEGDSFYVVFTTASEAVAAASHAQLGVESFPWPRGERLRIRMGIHTGSPAVHDGAYVASLGRGQRGSACSLTPRAVPTTTPRGGERLLQPALLIFREPGQIRVHAHDQVTSRS